MIKLVQAIFVLGLVQQALVVPTIDIKLVTSLRQKPTVNIIISMKESPTLVLNQLEKQTFQSREDRLNTFGKTLKDFCSKSQKNVLQLLKEQESVKSLQISIFWITNQIAVRGADLELVQELAALSDISKIEEEFFLELDAPHDLKVVDNLGKANEEEFQWGVEQIEAPRVWNSGNKGQGIIVATIDTGVRHTHEALRDSFVGDYGWYDPFFKTLIPNDTHGHGTHTTAIIAGRARNIGVAPGAQWASCKGCDVMFCSQIDLFVCGHWVACPSLADGSAEDCSKAPHVVSNSWGGGRGNTWYRSVIEYYHSVRIVPVFSSGNSGPECGSVSSPGDYENVLGVGATTLENKVSNFSSAGPTVIGERVKPDVAAPGTNIFSAYASSDTAYASMSGTSMAAPHVAGAVALMLAESPDLVYSDIKAALENGVVPTGSSGLNCGGIPDGTFPNHHVGYGRINAFNSLRTLLHTRTFFTFYIKPSLRIFQSLGGSHYVANFSRCYSSQIIMNDGFCINKKIPVQIGSCPCSFQIF
ncbi:unnamed protein product [Allacma fusca]|uniref:Peptidase S8/S53 domain-containing protein n=1 Tax=Allacma fusca TaxID=39272 RepID=A0A8J2JJ39_9HEXA|nr:unnamed protein product [Allacma fusca]